MKRSLRRAGLCIACIAILAVLVVGPVGFVGPTAAASAQCGADETTAVRSALDQLPPERVTGRSWASAPLESNYDSCADLSTVLVMIEGGTGSSPIQALMFHRGTFLGTGTWKAYGFTSLDEHASSRDTVVLRYRF